MGGAYILPQEAELLALVETCAAQANRRLAVTPCRVAGAYGQRTSAEDLVPVPHSLSGSVSTAHDPLPMTPDEWNGNNNDRAFLMVGVSA
jgi:hypothetical protein